MWKKAVCFLLCVTNPLDSYAKTIRKIEVDDNKIVAINTALGYSTIIEFSSKPVSVVLGDQDAFKVEYIGSSITVKPLIPHAKSNLFVFTESDRFNCMLRTGSSVEVDYIVRVSPPRPSIMPDKILNGRSEGVAESEQPSVKVTSVHKKATYDGYALRVVSIGKQSGGGPGNGVTVIEIELTSAKKDYVFSARSVGVKQSGKFLFIENLYLDAIQLRPKQPAIRGKIVLLNKDINQARPIAVMFAVPHAENQKNVHRIEVKVGAVRGDKNEKRAI